MKIPPAAPSARSLTSSVLGVSLGLIAASAALSPSPAFTATDWVDRSPTDRAGSLSPRPPAAHFHVPRYAGAPAPEMPFFTDQFRAGPSRREVPENTPGSSGRGQEQFAFTEFTARPARTQSPGSASWYGEECRGLTMANGRPFNPDALTCASWYYPFGTILEIQHESHRVQVIVTDRGPRADLVRAGVLIDLSRRAFELLGDLELGHLAVTVQTAGYAVDGH
jgi:rare lipoprotein A